MRDSFDELLLGNFRKTLIRHSLESFNIVGALRTDLTQGGSGGSRPFNCDSLVVQVVLYLEKFLVYINSGKSRILVQTLPAFLGALLRTRREQIPGIRR